MLSLRIRVVNCVLLDVAADNPLSHPRTVFALIVINKAGGLVYNRSFTEGGLNQLSTNDYLIVAGTFHGYVTLCHVDALPTSAMFSPPRTSC